MMVAAAACVVVVLLFSPAAAAAAVVKEKEAGGGSDIDTDRDAIVLSAQDSSEGGEFRQDGVYDETVDVTAATRMELNGQKIDTLTHMHLGLTMTVHGREVDATIDEITMDVSGMGSNVHCDSSTSPEQLSGAQAMVCKPIQQLAGQSQHFVVDPQNDGGVLVASEPSDPSSTLGKASPGEQLQMTSRLLELVPKGRSVRPGDKWDASADLGGGAGSFTGVATLVGYVRCGRDLHDDCAVIETAGIMKMDLQKAMERMGEGMGGGMIGMKDLEVGDIAVRATMHFDYGRRLPRWSSIRETFEMRMKSPFDGKTMTIPVDETVVTTSDMRE